MYRVVVPARYGSTRFPGKPLIPLLGRPMLQWVYERARRSSAAEVLIATDDRRIVEAARSFGAPVMLTAATHRSGTDRIAEVARQARWADDEIVVNVQGDEPLMPEALIDQVAAMLESRDDSDIATLAAPIESPAALLDPNVVKVVTDRQQRALYFSRAPIPWRRDAAGAADVPPLEARRHIGIYAYRVAALARLADSAPSPLELLEQLEQLRALENGLDIRVANAIGSPGADVNTAADVPAVEALLAQRAARS